MTETPDPAAVQIKIPDWPGLVAERNRLVAELDAARAEIEQGRLFLYRVHKEVERADRAGVQWLDVGPIRHALSDVAEPGGQHECRPEGASSTDARVRSSGPPLPWSPPGRGGSTTSRCHHADVARQSSQRKRAVLAQRTEASLRADLQRLRVETASCYSSDCHCHRAEWQEISTIRALLGEDPTV